MAMQEIRGQRLTGERALFAQRDALIEDCVFEDGESPLKESRDVTVKDTVFRWKYPLWYSDRVEVTNSLFEFNAHAAFWYSRHMRFADCTIQAPKEFRRNEDVTVERTAFTNAAETFWQCRDVTLRHVSANGDYFAMDCAGMHVSDFQLTGNYCFDGARDITVERARLLSKDAFWNCENVTVRDSFISGEYLAWNTRNITFENCTIESLQGLCYIDGLTMRDCRLINTTRAFEYCTGIDADITTHVDGVVNPVSGTIRAAGFGDVVQDDPKIDTTGIRLIDTRRTPLE